jgi:hypothetical protein
VLHWIRVCRIILTMKPQLLCLFRLLFLFGFRPAYLLVQTFPSGAPGRQRQRLWIQERNEVLGEGGENAPDVPPRDSGPRHDLLQMIFAIEIRHHPTRRISLDVHPFGEAMHTHFSKRSTTLGSLSTVI